jgi:uncharacterized protein (DUF342 family)
MKLFSGLSKKNPSPPPKQNDDDDSAPGGRRSRDAAGQASGPEEKPEDDGPAIREINPQRGSGRHPLYPGNEQAKSIGADAFGPGRNSNRAGQGIKSDGEADFRLSEDAMELRADFFPPKNGGAPLTREYIESCLLNLNVVRGVDWEAIQEALDSCNLEGKVHLDLVIAKGAEPVPTLPGRIELAPGLIKDGPGIDQDAARVDFKAVTPLVMVAADQVLGKYLEPDPGANGFDVTGKEILGGKQGVKVWELGTNVRQEGDRVLASKSGRISIQGDRRVSVEEVLEVKTAVDYHTGHIVFPGDVILDGGIEDGFKVYAGASIHCKTTIDATDVNAKADLVVQGGIIGRHNGQVRVGGRLEAKFVENCRVAVKGDARVGSAIVNSRFFALGSLDMGDKGRIAGGEIWAMRGVKAARIGTPTGKQVTITCGIDFTVKQQLDVINQRLRILTAKELKAKELSRAKPSSSLDSILKEIAAMQSSLLKALEELGPRLNAAPEAKVEVRDLIFPGVLVTIMGSTVMVEKEQKRVRLRFDQEQQRIVLEPLP